MPDEVKFQLGPLVVGVQGNHPIVDWANHAFDLVRSQDTPAIQFDFKQSPLQVSDDAVQYHLPRFDLAVRNENAIIKVDIFHRDQRSLLARSFSAPGKTWRTWLAQGGSLDLGVIKDFAYKTNPFLLQSVLLNAGASLAHASAMSVGNEALLLAADSRVGKTSVLLAAALSGRAKFLADDHAIVDRDGFVHLHPMPMHVYPHSLKQNPQLRKFDSWQWKLGRKLDQKHAVRWLLPQDVFGTDTMDRKARLSEVIILQRGNELAFRSAKSTEVAERCETMIMDELHEFTQRLLTADGRVLPTVAVARAAIRRIFESAFAGSQCGIATVPANTHASNLVTFLRPHSPLLYAAVA